MTNYAGPSPQEKLFLWSTEKYFLANQIILSTNPYTAYGASLDEMADVVGISKRNPLETDLDLRDRILLELGVLE